MTRPSCIGTPEIGDRMREIQRERAAVISGCTCPVDSHIGAPAHAASCPLYEPPPAPATPPVPNGLPPKEAYFTNCTITGCPACQALADHRRAIADAIAEGSAGR